MSDPKAFSPEISKEAQREFELIRAIGSGDASAFESLVRKYQNPVLNFIYKYIGDRFGAEDLTQEVFLSVFRSACRFEPRGKVSTWIFTIAYNLCCNEIARRKRLQLVADLETEGGGFDLQSPGHAEDREIREELMECIGRLPEKQRAALLLRVDDELSYSEIGSVLAVSVSSVESLLFRARENLRRMLRKN